MKVGDLVRYHQTHGILIVVKLDDTRVMVRCFCPHLQEYYWFYPDALETICK
jgi:hypothetical protein